MAPAPIRLARVEGVRFSKLMGCGGGNGFSLRPNLDVYVWLAVWKTEAAAHRFFDGHPWWRSVGRLGSERMVFWLRPTMAHGSWNGRRPFEAHADEYELSAPVAVFTRATVKVSKLWDFRRHVGPASRAVDRAPERLLSMGIGEYPLVMQATFSLWQSGRAMRDFAYRCPVHKDIIARTRERGWYREELFSRMRILNIEGSWNGRNGVEWLADLRKINDTEVHER